MKNNYIHFEKRFWIFRFSFYKLGQKWSMRFEFARGWDNS